MNRSRGSMAQSKLFAQTNSVTLGRASQRARRASRTGAAPEQGTSIRSCSRLDSSRRDRASIPVWALRLARSSLRARLEGGIALPLESAEVRLKLLPCHVVNLNAGPFER